MIASLVALTVGFCLAQTPAVRTPHPFAPSLPQLTKQEEAKIQGIIDRFIQYDIGKLPGAEGKMALEEFNRLGPEAIFQLIDSFNYAATLEHSCPVVIIGRKIGTILGRSLDLELLTFAKENVGGGVTVRRHMGTVKDMQAGILFRRAAVHRQLAFQAANGGFAIAGKLPPAMTPQELIQAARQEKGRRLQGVLTEAGKRPAPLNLDILVLAAARPDKEAKDLAHGLLQQNLAQQNDADLRKFLKHDTPEIRAAAVQAAGKRGWGAELIELLDDTVVPVQKAAHQALVQLNRGSDLGPANWTSPGDRATAVARWKSWWREKQASP